MSCLITNQIEITPNETITAPRAISIPTRFARVQRKLKASVNRNEEYLKAQSSVSNAEQGVQDMEQSNTDTRRSQIIGAVMLKLSENLQNLCELRGMSLSKLAKVSGVPKSTIHAWTKGRQSLDFVQLKKVSRVLEVSLHELLYGEPDPFEGMSGAMLKELFSGDVRVTVHRIERRRNLGSKNSGGVGHD